MEEELESVSERLLKSGLYIEHEWKVNIQIFSNINYPEVQAEIKKISTSPDIKENINLQQDLIHLEDLA